MVRPEWVTCSIQAGKLLPVEDFISVRPREAPGQARLIAFAQHAGRWRSVSPPGM